MEYGYARVSSAGQNADSQRNHGNRLDFNLVFDYNEKKGAAL